MAEFGETAFAPRHPTMMEAVRHAGNHQLPVERCSGDSHSGSGRWTQRSITPQPPSRARPHYRSVANSQPRETSIGQNLKMSRVSPLRITEYCGFIATINSQQASQEVCKFSYNISLDEFNADLIVSSGCATSMPLGAHSATTRSTVVSPAIC